MKRRLQFAVLFLVPLLIMQSASASVLCSAWRNSCSGCSDNGSNSSPDRKCPETPSPTVSNQSACCQVGSPEPAQQVRANPPGAEQQIAYETTGQTPAWLIEPILSGLQLNPAQAIRPHADSLQSLYSTFLI